MDAKVLGDAELIMVARGLKPGQVPALMELVDRALANTDLLDVVCEIISSDHRIQTHHIPIGWFAADRIFLSENETAMRTLVQAMATWEVRDQELLVKHWAGQGDFRQLASDLNARYGWATPVAL